MGPDEIADLLDKARKLWPEQDFPDTDAADWRENLGQFSYSEVLIAMSLLRQWHRSISPRQIRERVHIVQRIAARPEFQPSGTAWEKAQAARGGADYTGGAADLDAWEAWAASRRGDA